MPDVLVSAPAATAAIAPAHPKARLVTEGGTEFEFPWAPAEVSKDGSAATWAQLDRPGLKPLLVKNGDGLETLTFSVLLGSKDREDDYEVQIGLLRKIAQAATAVQFVYSGFEQGWWTISGLSVVSVTRTPLGLVSRATVAITLTEGAPAGARVGVKSVYRYHVWRAGETLYGLARTYLGAGSRWPEIAKLNKLANATIVVGKRLTIPPR